MIFVSDVNLHWVTFQCSSTIILYFSTIRRICSRDTKRKQKLIKQRDWLAKKFVFG